MTRVPRATKIVATLGPACSDPAVLQRMIAAGVDVVRLNFSHGTADDHMGRARLVREIAGLFPDTPVAWHILPYLGETNDPQSLESAQSA